MNTEKTTAQDKRVADLMRTAYTPSGEFAHKGRQLTADKKLARKLMAEAAFDPQDLVDGYEVYGAMVRLCFPADVKHGSDPKLKLYEVDFVPLYPVGCCLWILAYSKEEATLLATKTITHTSAFKVSSGKPLEEGVVVFMDGNY